MCYSTYKKTEFSPRLIDMFLLLLLPLLLYPVLLPGDSRAASLSAANNSSVAQTYFAEGLDRIIAQDWPGAATLFEQSWVTNPENIKVLRYVAMAYNFSLRMDKSRVNELKGKAFFYANKLLEVDTETADAHYFLGTLYVSTDRKKAILHFSKFVGGKIHKDKSLVGGSEDKIGSVYGMLGYLYGAEGDYKKCLESLRAFVDRCDKDNVYAKRVARAKGVVEKLEEFFKYKNTYDSINSEATYAPSVQKQRDDAGDKKFHANTESQQRRAIPSEGSKQRMSPKQNSTKQEYEKIKESLDKELKDRMRDIEILTG